MSSRPGRGPRHAALSPVLLIGCKKNRDEKNWAAFAETGYPPGRAAAFHHALCGKVENAVEKYELEIGNSKQAEYLIGIIDIYSSKMVQYMQFAGKYTGLQGVFKGYNPVTFVRMHKNSVRIKQTQLDSQIRK